MIIHRFSSAFAAVFAFTAQATDLPQLSFSHNDWEIACDNTRTSRAAGYQADDASTAASVLLTHNAGPNAPIHADVQFAPGDEVPPRVQMQIGGRPFGEVATESARGSLNEQQTAALLKAVLKKSDISWIAKGQRWTLSTAGANAVLLKMDEFQGRLGTPGALIRKGTTPETSVLPPLHAPEIMAPNITWSAPDEKLLPAGRRAGLLAELRKTVSNGSESDCEALDDKDAGQRLTIWRLSAQHMLVAAECWRAAYNIGEAYWVIQAQAPYSPVLVTTSGSDYAEGKLSAYQKGRGVGDCGSSDTWTWDGRRFVHTEAATSGLCKGFAGGAWSLATLTIKVNKAK